MSTLVDLLCKISTGVTWLPIPGNVRHGNPKRSAGELVPLVISVGLGACWSHVLLKDLWLHCVQIQNISYLNSKSQKIIKIINTSFKKNFYLITPIRMSKNIHVYRNFKKNKNTIAYIDLYSSASVLMKHHV